MTQTFDFQQLGRTNRRWIIQDKKDSWKYLQAFRKHSLQMQSLLKSFLQKYSKSLKEFCRKKTDLFLVFPEVNKVSSLEEKER